MTYDETVATLQTLLEIPLNQSDVNFTRIIPTMFLYAESRICGDLNFLLTTVTQQGQLTAGSRTFVLPDSVRILEHINVCVPVGPISNTSKRITLERISPVALDMFWPQASFKQGVPQKYAVIGDTAQATLQLLTLPPATPPQVFSLLVRLMPTPDRNYMIEHTGVARPLSLSPTNKETFITAMYPELFICACMVFASGYQLDFGSQADDPAKAQSWDGQYKVLLDGILSESSRRRGEGPDFTALPPTPM